MNTDISILSFEDDIDVVVDQELSPAEVAGLQLELSATSLESDMKDIDMALVRVNLTVRGVESIEEAHAASVASMEDDNDLDSKERKHLEFLMENIGATREVEASLEEDDKSFMKTVKDLLKKAWAKIKAFFKMIGDMIGNFITKILNYFSGVEAKFKRLEGSATKAYKEYKDALGKVSKEDKEKAEKEYDEMDLGKIKATQTFIKDDAITENYFVGATQVVNTIDELVSFQETVEKGRTELIRLIADSVNDIGGSKDNEEVAAKLEEFGKKAEKSDKGDEMDKSMDSFTAKYKDHNLVNFGISDIPHSVMTLTKKGDKAATKITYKDMKEAKVTGGSIGALDSLVKDLSKSAKVIGSTEKKMKSIAKSAAASKKDHDKLLKKADKVSDSLAKNPKTAKSAMGVTTLVSATTGGYYSVKVSSVVIAGMNRLVSIYSKDLAGTVSRAIPKVEKITRDLVSNAE